MTIVGAVGSRPTEARLIYRLLRHGHDSVDIGETAYDHQLQTRRRPALSEPRASATRSCPALTPG